MPQMVENLKHTYNIQYCSLSNGCNIAYIDEGSGPQTLLFIHGLANAALCWKKNIEGLKNYYRCIAIDLPGNGYSSHGNYPYGISFFADAVYELVQKLQLDKLCIAGHSMGSQVAMATAIKYPDICNNLVLCAPAGFETFTPFEKTIYHSTIYFLDFFSKEDNSLRSVMQSSFFKISPQASEMIEELVGFLKTYPMGEYRTMIDACIASMLNEPVYDKLSQIKQRTLVLFGERDALIPNKMIHHFTTKQLAEETVELLPNATLKVLPQCGHFLHWEKADEVNELIEQFVSGK